LSWLALTGLAAVLLAAFIAELKATMISGNNLP